MDTKKDSYYMSHIWQIPHGGSGFYGISNLFAFNVIIKSAYINLFAMQFSYFINLKLAVVCYSFGIVVRSKH